jgi:hypothetical protein
MFDPVNRFKQSIIDQKPITTQDIWRLMHEIFTTISGSTTAINNECSICMEESGCDHTLSCGHGFHRACISRWLEDSSVCPYCRQSTMSYHDIDIKDCSMDLEHHDGMMTSNLTRDSHNRMLSKDVDVHMYIESQSSTIHIQINIELFEGKPSVSVQIVSIRCGDVKMEIPMDLCSDTLCLESICEEIKVYDLTLNSSYHLLKDLIQYWMYGCA